MQSLSQGSWWGHYFGPPFRPIQCSAVLPILAIKSLIENHRSIHQNHKSFIDLIKCFFKCKKVLEVMFTQARTNSEHNFSAIYYMFRHRRYYFRTRDLLNIASGIEKAYSTAVWLQRRNVGYMSPANEGRRELFYYSGIVNSSICIRR
jgi:hypothetical protein